MPAIPLGSINGGGWTMLPDAAPLPPSPAATAVRQPAPAAAPACASARAFCQRLPCARHPRACAWGLACLQTAALVVTAYLAVAAVTLPRAQPGTIVREFAVTTGGGPGAGGGGCPVRTGAPVSLTDAGAARSGGGTSVYRGASEIFFAAPVASHALAALDAGTLLAGFASSGAEAGSGTLIVGAATDAGAKVAAWSWSGFAPLVRAGAGVRASRQPTTFAARAHHRCTLPPRT